MRWPWVSRLAYELVLEERDRLRAQVDEILDLNARLSRRSLNLPEQPRPPRPAPVPVEVPDDIEELLEGFGSEAVRAGVRAQLLARMQDPRESWDRLRSELVRQLPEPEEES